VTDDTERTILEALQRVLETVDPPPDHVIANAREAFTWHGIDAELAELVYDSATEPAPVAVRTAEAARQVTFRAPGLEIEVEVVSERARIVIGQLIPAQTATVELRRDDETRETTADTLGRFTFTGVTPGAIMLTVVTSSGVVVQTEGLTI
jgi:hypothetical protein